MHGNTGVGRFVGVADDENRRSVHSDDVERRLPVRQGDSRVQGLKKRAEGHSEGKKKGRADGCLSHQGREDVVRENAALNEASWVDRSDPDTFGRSQRSKKSSAPI